MTKSLLACLASFALGICATLLTLASSPVALGTLAEATVPTPAPRPVVAFLARDPQPKTTDDLALKLTPHVQQFIADNKQAFTDNAGGPLERLAIRVGIPIAQRETPVVLEFGLKKLAAELNSWTIQDVLRWLETVADEGHQPEGRLARELRALRAERYASASDGERP